MPSSSSSASSWEDDKKKNLDDEKQFDSEGNELYVVEAIKGKKKTYDPKKKRHVWLYHLKWKGYSYDEMTWEPIENLDCPDLLHEFEEKWKKKQTEKEKKERHRSRHDSDEDMHRPSTSGLSKEDLKEAVKRSKVSDKRKRSDAHSDSSDSEHETRKRDRERDKAKRHREKEKSVKKSRDDDRDNDRERKTSHKKRITIADSEESENDVKKSKNDSEDEKAKKLLSKPGPKRAKEARLAKLKASSTPAKADVDNDTDSRQSINKISKASDNESQKSDKDIKVNNDKLDENAKRILSKPGPKRAKEARLAKLNTSKEVIETPIKVNQESKQQTITSNKIEDESDSEINNNENNDRIKKVLSKPGPKRAKEARLAKINAISTDATKTNNEITSDNDNGVLPNSDSEEKAKETQTLNEDSKTNNDKSDCVSLENSKIMSKPGPKRAKEARLARMMNKSSLEKDDTFEQNNINTKDNDSDVDKPNEKESNIVNDSQNNIDIHEEKKRSVMSRPGPKRAKEARLAKMSENFNKDSSLVEELPNKTLDKRTKSTDSLDEIISTPVAVEDSEEIEQQLVAEISQNDVCNGEINDIHNTTNTTSNDNINIEKRLSDVQNYASIEASRHLTAIASAASSDHSDRQMMYKPGYIKPALPIKSLPLHKTPEKIVCAFYNEDTLCYLIKWKNMNNCDIIEAKQFNTECPQIAIDFYQQNLKFT